MASHLRLKALKVSPGCARHPHLHRPSEVPSLGYSGGVMLCVEGKRERGGSSSLVSHVN